MSPPWPPWRGQKSCPMSHSSALSVLHSGLGLLHPLQTNLCYAHRHMPHSPCTGTLSSTSGEDGHQKETPKVLLSSILTLTCTDAYPVTSMKVNPPPALRMPGSRARKSKRCRIQQVLQRNKYKKLFLCIGGFIHLNRLDQKITHGCWIQPQLHWDH